MCGVVEVKGSFDVGWVVVYLGIRRKGGCKSVVVEIVEVVEIVGVVGCSKFKLFF